MRSPLRRSLPLVALAGALPVVMLSVFPAPAHADDLKELARKTTPSVVLLEVYGASGAPLGNGTGFFVGPQRVVTNHHVAEPAAHMVAVLADGSKVDVEGVLAEDEDHDLTLLAVPADVPPLELSYAPVETGEEIVVIGNPLGLSSTLSTGIVAAVRPQDETGLVEGPVVQITAAISPGSSGSPVMTLDGRVVAVAVGQYVVGQNLNFAIPADRVAALLAKAEDGSRLRTYGKQQGFQRVAYVRNVAVSLVFFGLLVWAYRKLR